MEQLTKNSFKVATTIVVEIDETIQRHLIILYHSGHRLSSIVLLRKLYPCLGLKEAKEIMETIVALAFK